MNRVTADATTAAADPVRPLERCPRTATHPFTLAVQTQCKRVVGHEGLCAYADLWEPESWEPLT